jgi:ABC-type Zn2+ transport system substrate-binding protein/surface adhesin
MGQAVRVWMLMAMLVGTLISSLGALNTHALAVLDAVEATDMARDDDHEHDHGHSHDDGWLANVDGATHTHLGADHSHDKAHALPGLPRLAGSDTPGWARHPVAWSDRLLVHRLERPPKPA